jgi:hypothetical protein
MALSVFLEAVDKAIRLRLSARLNNATHFIVSGPVRSRGSATSTGVLGVISYIPLNISDVIGNGEQRPALSHVNIVIRSRHLTLSFIYIYKVLPVLN